MNLLAMAASTQPVKSPAVREAKSFCRTCIAECGVVLSIDAHERIIAVRGDKTHPVSAGYACFKGLQAPGSHYGPARLLQSQKRMPDGKFVAIPIEQALDEIAAKLTAIRARSGAEAIGLFRGTAGFHNSTAFGIHGSFLKALGSPSLFTTLTIDQSAKAIAACRLGSWQAGRYHIDESNVALIFGSNPLVSHSAGGFLVSDPVKRLKTAVARGLKLIVIDPRVTETARFAALHLQPYPGEDVSIAAALLKIILNQGWHDKDFCSSYVAGLDALMTAVQPFTAEFVAARAGVPETLLYQAAELFAAGAPRGGVLTGTGPNMAPRSNLAEHLIQCIEVVCGRFKRAGDQVPNIDPLSPPRDWYAEVAPPFAPWDGVPPSRIRGVGNLFGEKLTATLAEEITTPGAGQIRALIVNGANIANSVPGKRDITAALNSLELLVVIDPHLTSTAQLADYVIAPKLQFERADLPITLGIPLHADGWVQYTPAIVPPPAGAEVVDDWYVFWALAKRMGLALDYAGHPLDMNTPPSTDDLLSHGMNGTALSLEELKNWPDQTAFNPAGAAIVKPARDGANGRFRLNPEGVLDELSQVFEEGLPTGQAQKFSFRLISRRMRDVNGSIGMQTPEIRQRNPYNPLHMNPRDMRRLGLAAKTKVKVTSADGSIDAIACADDSLREGVASMSHNWGGLPDGQDDIATTGSSTNMLISTLNHYEVLNAMPRMSAIPINISASFLKKRSKKLL